jgi:integrase
VDDSTIEGYEKIYRTHIGPVIGSRPVASITTADVTAFRAALLAPHQRHQGGQPVTRSPKTVKHIVGTLKRILDNAQDNQAIAANPVVSGRRRHTTKRRATSDGKQPFKHRPLTANQVVADAMAKVTRLERRKRLPA